VIDRTTDSVFKYLDSSYYVNVDFLLHPTDVNMSHLLINKNSSNASPSPFIKHPPVDLKNVIIDVLEIFDLAYYRTLNIITAWIVRKVMRNHSSPTMQNYIPNVSNHLNKVYDIMDFMKMFHYP